MLSPTPTPAEIAQSLQIWTIVIGLLATALTVWIAGSRKHWMVWCAALWLILGGGYLLMRNEIGSNPYAITVVG